MFEYIPPTIYGKINNQLNTIIINNTNSSTNITTFPSITYDNSNIITTIENTTKVETVVFSNRTSQTTACTQSIQKKITDSIQYITDLSYICVTHTNDINNMNTLLSTCANSILTKQNSIHPGHLLNSKFVQYIGTGINISTELFLIQENINDLIVKSEKKASAVGATLSNPKLSGVISGFLKNDIGLNNVNNTADINKPISNAFATALLVKADSSGVTLTGVISGISKDMVNLSNVENTREINKPISTYTQQAIHAKANLSGCTFTGPVYGLNRSTVNLSNVDNRSDVSKNISIDVSSALLLLAPKNNPTFVGTVTGVTKKMVGLENVDNVSDQNKPTNTNINNALLLKADLTGSTFTGPVYGIDKNTVQLSLVDNVSDTNKPVSTALNSELIKKAGLSNPTFNGDINTNGNIIFNNTFGKIKYPADTANKILTSDASGWLTLQTPSAIKDASLSIATKISSGAVNGYISPFNDFNIFPGTYLVHMRFSYCPGSTAPDSRVAYTIGIYYGNTKFGLPVYEDVKYGLFSNNCCFTDCTFIFTGYSAPLKISMLMFQDPGVGGTFSKLDGHSYMYAIKLA